MTSPVENLVQCRTSLIRTYFQNIRSLKSKTDALQHLLEYKQLDIICLCETWLTETASEYCPLEGFHLASRFCRSRRIRGGTAIYTALDFATKDLKNLVGLSQELHCEIAAVEITTLHIVVVCVYRSNSPESDPEKFFQIFHELLEKLIRTKKIFFIYGDFNFNLLENGSIDRHNFVNLLNSFGLQFLVDKATRITYRHRSCLDNCITNFTSDCDVSVLSCHMSDHEGLYINFNLPQSGNFCNKTEVGSHF